MNTDDIIKLARECGGIADDQTIVLWHGELVKFAALVTQAERESRQAAQAENEQLKARLARSGVELRKAVRDEREACQLIADDLTGMLFCHGDKSGSEIAMSIRDNIRARNHIVDANKMDCTDCDCADNEPCKRTAPGLALESGEFVPASEIAYHPV